MDKPVSFIAPEGQDLDDFVKNAPVPRILYEIRLAACSIEHPDVKIRARRTMSFIDDMPNVLQAAFQRGYMAGYLQAYRRREGEPTQ